MGSEGPPGAAVCTCAPHALLTAGTAAAHTAGACACRWCFLTCDTYLLLFLSLFLPPTCLPLSLTACLPTGDALFPACAPRPAPGPRLALGLQLESDGHNRCHPSRHTTSAADPCKPDDRSASSPKTHHCRALRSCLRASLWSCPGSGPFCACCFHLCEVDRIHQCERQSTSRLWQTRYLTFRTKLF